MAKGLYEYSISSYHNLEYSPSENDCIIEKHKIFFQSKAAQGTLEEDLGGVRAI
jgi:hypothetical protein